MGCFSFMCTECGKPINSNSFSGENVRLSLLENGKVREEMQGQYDSYGRVFDDTNDMNSVDWQRGWDAVCDLMFDDNPDSGISAAHVACITPDYEAEKVSEDDPDQGWGNYKSRHTKNKCEHFHKVY